MNKKVSVIIPFYNGSKWIERALKSVSIQTVKPDYVIVVNDGSKAEERAALGEFQKKYDFIILDKENGGQGSARNLGAEYAEVDYLCFLDQDDYYLDNHIEVLLKSIPEKDRYFGVVYGDCKEGDGDGNIIRTSMVKDLAIHPKNNIWNLVANDMFILPSASLISRKAFFAVNGFDTQFTGYEDDDLFMRMFRAGFNLVFVDVPVYVWCINSESVSYSIRMSRSRFKYFKKLIELFPDCEASVRFPLRDLIAPRFEKTFLSDCFKFKGTKDEDEVLSIYRGYKEIIVNSKNTSLKSKLRVRLISKILPFLPKNSIYILRIGIKLPFLRKIFY